jgi:pimeloyl-ACP methyl ester carboxylesterase
MTAETTTATLVSRDGTRIVYDHLGAGRPLIMVGGALSDRSHPTVQHFASVLARYFTVFKYDRRGRGDSGDTPPYEAEREFEDLQAVIQAAGGPVFLHGTSSGAVLALETAARAQGVAKLALYEPPFIVDDGRAPLLLQYRAHIENLLASGRRSDALVHFMTVGVGMPAASVEAMRNGPEWPGLERLAHTVAYDNAIVGEYMEGKPLPGERWRSVTMPTLVMSGGDSPAWLQRSAEVTARALPNATHRTLLGQQHAVAPEALAPVLVEF